MEIRIGDSELIWRLRLGIGIRDGGLDMGIGDYDWGFGIGIEIGEWDWRLGIGDGGLGLGIGIGDWGLGLGLLMIAGQNRVKEWVTVKRHTGFRIFVTYLICHQRLDNDIF